MIGSAIFVQYSFIRNVCVLPIFCVNLIHPNVFVCLNIRGRCDGYFFMTIVDNYGVNLEIVNSTYESVHSEQFIFRAAETREFCIGREKDRTSNILLYCFYQN